MFLVRITGMAQESEGVAGGKRPELKRCSGDDAKESGSSAISTVIRGHGDCAGEISPLGQLRGGLLLPGFRPVPKRGLQIQAPKAEARPRRVQHKG